MSKFTIRKYFRKVFKRLFDVSEEEIKNEILSKGGYIGKNVKLFNPNSLIIDLTRPWLLHIGDYTKITSGVVVLTHDYSLSVLRRKFGEWIGEGQKTFIGNNCFIGMNSIRLMGTYIGDNCIVGAGSVVRGQFPDNVVIAGNPAKIVCTIDEHYKKRKEKSVDEAKYCLNEYVRIFNKIPKPSELGGFGWQFTPRDINKFYEYGFSFKASGDEEKEIREAFLKSKPIYQDYDDFIKKCLDNEEI